MPKWIVLPLSRKPIKVISIISFACKLKKNSCFVLKRHPSPTAFIYLYIYIYITKKKFNQKIGLATLDISIMV